jgi:hypothetical protein
MEGTESTHLQEPKMDDKKDQGNNNLHDKRNGIKPQLPNRRSATHRPRYLNSRGFSTERRMQAQSGKMTAATTSR